LKLLVIGALTVLVVGLLVVAVARGYSQDQVVIRWFPGTGIAGKIDVAGRLPPYLLIEDTASGPLTRAPLASDGTFVVRLDPGTYRLQLPQDTRSASVTVPGGHCLDLVLDFRLPLVVLEIPGEGWPVPRLTA
jgi:hypothetical protein